MRSSTSSTMSGASASARVCSASCVDARAVVPGVEFRRYGLRKNSGGLLGVLAWSGDAASRGVPGWISGAVRGDHRTDLGGSHRRGRQRHVAPPVDRDRDRTRTVRPPGHVRKRVPLQMFYKQTSSKGTGRRTEGPCVSVPRSRPA